MFSIFSSKNKKLVKQWEKEHQEIILLAEKITDNYKSGKHGAAKKALKKLLVVAGEHLMEEDSEINHLVADKKRNNSQIEYEVKKFKDSFVGVKKLILDFLWHYSQDDEDLDDEFIEKFNDIVSALAKRIEFEEENLYTKLVSD
jgi:hemerythrin-like domain-containing protein